APLVPLGRDTARKDTPTGQAEPSTGKPGPPAIPKDGTISRGKCAALQIPRTWQASIRAEQIAAVNLFLNVLEIRRKPIGQDHVGFALELLQVVDDPRTEEFRLLEHGLVDDHFHALGLDALH